MFKQWIKKLKRKKRLASARSEESLSRSFAAKPLPFFTILHNPSRFTRLIAI